MYEWVFLDHSDIADLLLQALVKDIDVLLMTAHLESTGAFEAERKQQLVQCFSAMKEADQKKTVLFGGDLNLRDKEVKYSHSHISCKLQHLLLNVII